MSSLTEGRLGTRPYRGLVEQVNAVELRDEMEAVEEFILVDLAHVLMLTDTGIFDRGSGRSIVAALLRLLDGDPSAVLSPDPAIGTITLQLERYLEGQCGPVGLDIQRARSRIDQKATGVRMAARRAWIEVTTELLNLGETLLSAADEYDDVIAPGYTHLQHSQPTTLGHWFNAHYWAASRNLARTIQTFDRLNVSPLGGAAYSGTSWPIDRRATAAYLGFSGPIPNARDAGMAAMDVGAEMAATLALTLSGISRCASDLYYWSSSEVQLVRLHASLCGTSSMMPQKRNPIVLERIRALAGDAAGWGASQVGLLHTATSTDADQSYVHNRIPQQARDTAGAIDLLRESVATLDVDVERMLHAASSHGSTASALADDLVRHHGMTFREAHHQVARWIAATEHTRPSSDDRTPGERHPYADRRSDETPATLGAPEFVESRTSEGGTSRSRRAELAAAAQTDLALHRGQVSQTRRSVQQALDRLLADARAFAA